MKELVAIVASLSPRRQPVLFGATLLALNEALAFQYEWNVVWKGVGIALVAWMVKAFTVTVEEAEIGAYTAAVEQQNIGQYQQAVAADERRKARLERARQAG